MAKSKQARAAPVRTAADRTSIASRVEKSVHEQIAGAATAAGRTLSEEIEKRLTDSVRRPNLIAELFSSERTVRLIEGVARTAELIESDYPGEDWRQNPALNSEMHAAIDRFLAIAMVEDRGPAFFPSELVSLGASPHFNIDNAKLSAEIVAKILGFKSLVPDPETRLREAKRRLTNLEKWLEDNNPDGLAAYRAEMAKREPEGSAGGPQAETARKSEPSKP